jgi:hypothetical protein
LLTILRQSAETPLTNETRGTPASVTTGNRTTSNETHRRRCEFGTKALAAKQIDGLPVPPAAPARVETCARSLHDAGAVLFVAREAAALTGRTLRVALATGPAVRASKVTFFCPTRGRNDGRSAAARHEQAQTTEQCRARQLQWRHCCCSPSFSPEAVNDGISLVPTFLREPGSELVLRTFVSDTIRLSLWRRGC